MFSVRALLRPAKTLPIVYLMAFGSCPLLFAREWTDSSGKYHVEAEFVRLAGEKVLLRKPDGRVIVVAVERLNAEGRLAVNAASRAAAGQANNASPTKPITEQEQGDDPQVKVSAHQQNSQAISKIIAVQKELMLTRVNHRLAQASSVWGMVGKLLEEQSAVVSKWKIQTTPQSRSAGPVESIQTVVNGLADHRPRVLWEALPVAYQQDLKLLLDDCSTQMDPELWQAGRQLLQKSIVVIRSQREFFLQYPLVKEALSEGRAMANAATSQSFDQADENEVAAFESTVNVLELLVESDLADLPKLRTLDLGLFLDQTGVELMQGLAKASQFSSDDSFNEGLAMLADMQVSVIRMDGEKADIRLTLGEQSEANQMTMVDGKWIPAELVSAWPALMSTARVGLTTLKSKAFADVKPQLIEQLQGIDELLDQMLAAKTQDEFDALLDRLFVAEGEE